MRTLIVVHLQVTFKIDLISVNNITHIFIEFLFEFLLTFENVYCAFHFNAFYYSLHLNKWILHLAQLGIFLWLFKCNKTFFTVHISLSWLHKTVKNYGFGIHFHRNILI